MQTIIIVLLSPVLIYFAYAVGAQLLLAIAGHWRRPPVLRQPAGFKRFAVLIPAYREDAVIVNVARQALRQQYPSNLYEVVVIADSLQASTLHALRRMPIRVIEVGFEKSTKSKALRRALIELPKGRYDAIVILDADNIMAPDFLTKINHAMQLGFQAVQGQRTAQNLDTPIAVLDGAAEAMNNHFFCRGPRALGWSARLMGSGMAFDYRRFYDIMMTVDAIGGFDKELELKFTREKIRIAYQEEAIVYDEKVRQANTLSRQRSRWLAAQYHYLRQYWRPGLRSLARPGMGDFAHKVALLALPPRMVLPVVLLIGALAGWLFAGWHWITWVWIGLLAGNLLSFALAIPGRFFRKQYRKAWLHAGSALWQAVKATMKVHKANRTFIHTPHGLPSDHAKKG